MTTFRVEKRDRFTTIDRRAVNDERLSFRARGILTWLLDKPNDWTATRETIAAASPEGLHVVRGALKELADLGYLVRTKKRLENGRMVTETVVHEVPPEADYRPAVDRPAVDQPPKDRRLRQKTETETSSATPPKVPTEADRLARAEWERRNPKPVVPFPAFRMRIQEALDAGHSPQRLAQVLPTMTVFSRNAFDFALGGKQRPRTADAAMEADPDYWEEK